MDTAGPESSASAPLVPSVSAAPQAGEIEPEEAVEPPEDSAREPLAEPEGPSQGATWPSCSRASLQAERVTGNRASDVRSLKQQTPRARGDAHARGHTHAAASAIGEGAGACRDQHSAAIARVGGAHLQSYVASRAASGRARGHEERPRGAKAAGAAAFCNSATGTRGAAAAANYYCAARASRRRAALKHHLAGGAG